MFGSPFLYVVIRLVLLSTAVFVGVLQKNLTKKQRLISLAFLVLVFTFLEGSRYMPMTDYNHYIKDFISGRTRCTEIIYVFYVNLIYNSHIKLGGFNYEIEKNFECRSYRRVCIWSFGK